jgi:hypothetical protein
MRVIFVLLMVTALMALSPPANAHSGGLDSNGGHHCREAGFNSGKCSPLNSYHCHSAGCVVPGSATTTQPKPTTTSTSPPTTTTTTAATSTSTSTSTTTSTTTTQPSTTTTTSTTTSTTTTQPSTTTTTVDLSNDSTEAGAGGAFLGLGILGAFAYGGYRLVNGLRQRISR